VGSENGSVDFKSSGCKTKPPQWHACFFVSRGQQTEGHRPSAICLKYCSAAMYYRLEKEKKKKKENQNEHTVLIRSHAVIFRDNVRECSTIIAVQ
jgi:hypothetical protein